MQEFSVIAEDSCLIAQQAEAEKIFACCDMHGVTSLELLFDTQKNQNKLLWVNRVDGEIVAMLPVFIGDENLTYLVYSSARKVDEFCVCRAKKGDDYTYHLLCPDEQGRFAVRNMIIIANQKLVEGICVSMGIVPEKITFRRAYRIQDQSFVCNSWDVYGHQNFDGSFVKATFPVFSGEGELLDEVGVNNIYTREVKLGGIIKNEKDFYCLSKDEEGKLYLSPDVFDCRNSEAENERETEPADKKSVKCKSFTLISTKNPQTRKNPRSPQRMH